MRIRECTLCPWGPYLGLLLALLLILGPPSLRKQLRGHLVRPSPVPTCLCYSCASVPTPLGAVLSALYNLLDGFFATSISSLSLDDALFDLVSQAWHLNVLHVC